MLDEIAARQLGARPLEDDLPGLQHIAEIGDFQCTLGVLLHEQNRQALVPEVDNEVEDLVDDQRRKAKRGFIEQEQAWLR